MVPIVRVPESSSGIGEIMSNSCRIYDTTAHDRLHQILSMLAYSELEEQTLVDVRRGAVALTRRLAERGELPPHMLVEPDDPSVVVARTLAVALRRLSGRP